MTEVNRPGDHPGEVMALLAITFRWRRFLLINVTVAAVIAAGVSFLLPKWYRSTASILPPKDSDMLNPMAAAGSVLKGLNLGGRGGSGGTLGPYNYLAILKSRSALDSVVRKFNLTEVYGVDTSIEEAVKELKENTAFEVQDEDYITLEVLDKDPDRAAGIANFFVDVLNSMSLRLGTREARNNREFIEKRLEMTRTDLRAAEDALQAYQQRSKMVVIPEQGSSSVGGVADLYGMKAKKEVELAILRQSVGPDDPAIAQLELELREIDRKLETFPEISVESLRLYRNVVIKQKILEILLPLYEQAKVDEQKDVPVLLVLDRAVKAEKKATPKRGLIVLASASITLLLSLLLAFLFQRASGLNPLPGPLGDLIRRWSTAVARTYRISHSGS
jgi:uncharacterized protein involved in exopolysaccharide biosynthesis